MKREWIGKNVPRKEGLGKVTGDAVYVDDLALPGMIHGVTVRSAGPRGRIRDIRFEGDLPWDEFVVVKAGDIPGENVVTSIDVDQPCLAGEVVNHPDEPVVLLAHEDRGLLEVARRHVHIDLEPLPSVHTIDAAIDAGTVIWGDDNVFTEYWVRKGDVEKAFEHADRIIEGTYTTGAQEQLYIEPQGMLAEIIDGVVTIHGSMQCPFYIEKALAPLLGVEPRKIRIVQTTTGGGFGGKEEYPSMIAAHAALLARASGKPVKIVYDREEDIVATTKRHPSRTIHRTAVDRDGKLLALDIDFVIDGGAYKTLSPVVLSRGTIHAAGPYACDNVRIRARAVATNTPPHGAFRGFGAPQSIFALERHLDRVARTVGLQPEELRRRNFLRPGQSTAVSQVIREKIDLDRLLDTALAHSGYAAKRKAFDRHNARPNTVIRKGVGLAAFYHGSGFTGSGEVELASVVKMEARANGTVLVQASSTEIGQGTNTIFAQIAAQTLGIHYRNVEIAQPDTAAVPNSGPTVASRTVMVVGKLVERCARQILETLRGRKYLPKEYNDRDFADACERYMSRHGTLDATAQYEKPPDIAWDPEAFRGDAYGAYAWAVYVAEVSVDMRTYEVKVDDFVAVQEVGKAVHPVLAAGQIEGGVAQAIGYALYEKIVWKDGHVTNGQMTNYIMPTAVDTGTIRCYFLEEPYAHGPAGAKGIGELPMDGPAPAVCAAVEHALGVPMDHIPALPEDILAAVEGSRGAA